MRDGMRGAIAQPDLRIHSLLGIAQDSVHPLKGLEVVVGSLHSCASSSVTAFSHTKLLC